MRLAPGLHRIGSTMVNAYLVDDGGQVTIIDAGLPGHWSDLQAELTAMGRSLDDVRALVLTHGDTDHIGFAERPRRERGVPVYVHEADAARAQGQGGKPMSSWGPTKLGPLLGFLAYGARKGMLRLKSLTQVATFSEGTLAVPGSPRVLHVPGHTPGSVAIHVPSVDAVFLGDAFTTRNVLTGVEGPRIAPFTLDRRGALASLDKLDGIGARWVLPGHGEPFDGGLAEALRQIRANAAADAGPLTPPGGQLQPGRSHRIGGPQLLAPSWYTLSEYQLPSGRGSARVRVTMAPQ